MYPHVRAASCAAMRTGQLGEVPAVTWPALHIAGVTRWMPRRLLVVWANWRSEKGIVMKQDLDGRATLFGGSLRSPAAFYGLQTSGTQESREHRSHDKFRLWRLISHAALINSPSFLCWFVYLFSLCEDKPHYETLVQRPAS